MENKNNNPKLNIEKEVQSDFPGYPHYPPSEDIYENDFEEEDIKKLYSMSLKSESTYVRSKALLNLRDIENENLRVKEGNKNSDKIKKIYI